MTYCCELIDEAPKVKVCAIFVFALLVLSVSPVAQVVTESDAGRAIPTGSHALSNAVVLPGVPYVWQEINGLCNWAALSIIFQYLGVDLTLHDVLAASGAGFSWAYVRSNDTLFMFPGALFQQLEPTELMADLYGLNLTLYFSSDTIGLQDQIDYIVSRGTSYGLVSNEEESLDLVRFSIDNGWPLLISIDPQWLPAPDYDILREQHSSGGAHGVVIVGYNDTAGTVTIVDPGVGSFGEYFGYPHDGRGNYTYVTYTNLNQGWYARDYITMLLRPQPPAAENPESLLGPYLRDRLLGEVNSYAPGSPYGYLWDFGEAGFRAMSTDFTPSGLSSYIHVFDGIEQEVSFKSFLLLFIGMGLEAQITLQYLSFRAALERVSFLMPNVNLTSFVAAAEAALPHFEALADNRSLIDPFDVARRDTLVSSTFHLIADAYNSTGDLVGALAPSADNLSLISTHLLYIADSWRAAGEILATLWTNNPMVIYGPLIAIGALVVGLVAVTALRSIRRKPSQ